MVQGEYGSFGGQKSHHALCKALGIPSRKQALLRQTFDPALI
jgi:hypothetical protein